MLHRYAQVTAVATWLLLIAGGLVTSTASGLAVPDWPLSYGTWFPPMVGGVLFEHGHRMVAGLVGLMIIALALWVKRAEPRRWVRRLAATAAFAVLVQALLGGLTVLLLLPSAISIAHACLGQAVFCLVVAVAEATSPGWMTSSSTQDDGGHPSLQMLSLLIALLAAGQLVLGAIIRHTGHAVFTHMTGALALTMAVLWLSWRVFRAPQAFASLRPPTVRLLLGLSAQVVLGLAVFFHRGAIWLRTAHVAIGALVLAQAVLLVLRLKPPRRGTFAQDSTPQRSTWQVRRGMASSVASRRTVRSVMADFLELTKPRLTLLVLVATTAGWWVGLRSSPQWRQLALLLSGMAMVVGGANALNQWWERDLDALMRRTANRPLPAGRLRPFIALRFGFGLSVAGLACLIIGANGLTALLAAASWVSYILIYTPMKRHSALCTLIGAIPGASPPVIGWAAARNALGLEALALFAILFVWQLPHFLAIAVLYRDDYARAGFRLLPLLDAGAGLTARQTALYGLVLVPLSLVPTMIGLSGSVYFFGALALSAAFLMVSVHAAITPCMQTCRHLFLASVVYLPLLLGLLALNRAPL